MNPNYDVVKRQTIHNDSLEKYEKMKMDLQIELGNLNSCNNGPLQRNFHRTRLEGPQRPAVSFVRAHYEEEISLSTSCRCVCTSRHCCGTGVDCAVVLTRHGGTDDGLCRELTFLGRRMGLSCMREQKEL